MQCLQLPLSESAEPVEKQQEYARKLAATHQKQNRLVEAAGILEKLLDSFGQADAASLPLLCQAADIEVSHH